MNRKGLSVAVVGHANAGKTSLIRTLLRDSNFGEVADQAGTTRHVEGSALEIDEDNSLSLFDTPGLEDSMRLFHVLSHYFEGQDVDGIERLEYFLAHLTDYPEFDQEAKVLNTLLSNDLIFYVIDLREPVLGKYRDELQILSYASKPIIPVLNFSQQKNANLEEWKSQLARLNFHAFVDFDNVHFKFSDELKIYRKMQTLLADKEILLQRFIEQRQVQWDERLLAAQHIVAQLVVESGSLRFRVLDSEPEIVQATEQLQKSIRKAENKTVAQLLKLYQFRKEDLENSELAVEQDGWEVDLFSTDNLQEFGINLGGSIAKGAGVGVAIDLATAGMILGAAALTGGIAGALWGVKERYYDEIHAKIRGYRYICLNDVTMQVLWLRQMTLLNLLQQRGHASLSKIDYQVINSENSLPDQWSKWLRQLRNHPEWSSLNQLKADLEDTKRKELMTNIVTEIGQTILSV